MQSILYQCLYYIVCIFFFSSRRRHTIWPRDWSSDVCSSDLNGQDAFHLDLRTQGPHALVGGTTGAGKSEFLQAWVLGKIGRASCRERVLIDVVAVTF